MLTSSEAGKWLTYRAVDLLNRGQKCVREVTMAKLFTSELSQKVSYDCMQIFGGFWDTSEYPIWRAWRGGGLSTIGAGAAGNIEKNYCKGKKMLRSQLPFSIG